MSRSGTVALGPFRFEVPSTVLVGFDRSLPARHEEVMMVIGRRPSLHFAGPDVETLHLLAICYPAFLGGRGLTQIEGMRQAVLAGHPLMQVTARGQGLGRRVIERVGDFRTVLLPGGTPQRVEVALELKRCAADDIGGLLMLFGGR